MAVTLLSLKSAATLPHAARLATLAQENAVLPASAMNTAQVALSLNELGAAFVASPHSVVMVGNITAFSVINLIVSIKHFAEVI